MSTTPVATTPALYAIYDGEGAVIETTVTQIEAFRLVDWLTRSVPTAGPYRCAPVGQVDLR